MFTETLVTFQDMGAIQVPIDGQVDEETAIYAYNGIVFSLKKKILPIVTIWINLEDMIRSKLDIEG